MEGSYFTDEETEAGTEMGNDVESPVSESSCPASQVAVPSYKCDPLPGSRGWSCEAMGMAEEFLNTVSSGGLAGLPA